MTPLPSHVLRTAVALDDVRLLYVPVPKAGCTALLWALAEVAGLSEEDFARSRTLEVTRPLAVHDLSVWGPASHRPLRARGGVRGRPRRLPAGAWARAAPLRSANRSLLPYAPGVFDRPALDAYAPWTARDREAFGYALPAKDPSAPDQAWHAAGNASISAIRAVIERHERIADLRRIVREGERALA